jgi:hypothetical protein
MKQSAKHTLDAAEQEERARSRRWWFVGSLSVAVLLAALVVLDLPGEVVFVTGVIEAVQPIDTQAGPALSGSVRLQSGELVTVSLPRGALVGTSVRLSATHSPFARKARYRVVQPEAVPSLPPESKGCVGRVRIARRLTSGCS